MAGNERSGRGAHLDANATRNQARALAEKQWRKFMSAPDPDDIRFPSRMAKLFDEFYQLCVSRGISSHKGLTAALAQLIGKPVTPMELDVTMTPEESVKVIFEAIAKLKERDSEEPEGNETIQ